MDSFESKINPIAWPGQRQIEEIDWTPPAGTRIISVDDHGIEEMNLWENRLPAADKHRAPKLWRGEDNRFHFEVSGRNFDVPGLDSDIGEGRPSMWDVEARLKDMDAEGIETSLIFHARAMSLVALEDKEFFVRCIDVYNEWLAEYCARDPKRLIGVAILPTIYNPEASRDYLQKIKALGLKAIEIPSAPRNVPYNAKAMEPMWAAIAESGIPLSFHIGAYMEFRGQGAIGANLTKNLGPYRPLWSLLAFSGILERHPELKVVFCEGGFGWVPWTLQDADHVYRSYETEMRPKLGNLPSYYFRRQCYGAFMYDPVGVHVGHHYGLADNMVWSSDYPHGESTFGQTKRIIKDIFDEMGVAEATKVVGGNAAKLWNL